MAIRNSFISRKHDIQYSSSTFEVPNTQLFSHILSVGRYCRHTFRFVELVRAVRQP